METVSIIIPVYNTERYLRECLDSVVNQTYVDLEIIIVDDGSTDSSGEICDEYDAIDYRIKVIHQKNAGAANAKNTGLDNVTGNFVAFVDSDDYVSNKWIETMLQAMKRYNTDIVECGFDNIKTNGVSSVVTADEEKLFSAEDYLNKYLSHWESALFWNKLYKKEMVCSFRFRKERRCIDDEFFTYKVVSAAKSIVILKDVLVHYRQRKTSAVHTIENSLQITDDCLEYISERYLWISSRFNTLKARYLKHDINALLYFSRDLTFNEELIKKYKRIAKMYFRECLTIKTDKVTLLYAFRIAFLPKTKFNTSAMFVKQEENLFD